MNAIDKPIPAKPAAVESKPDTRNAHERFLDVMREVDYIQKDRKIPGQGGGYKVVTHDAVTAKVRPVLVKHGLVYYPQNLVHTQNGNRTEIRCDVVFVNAANPEDRIAVPTLGYGIDASDKGPGKAVSYAVKMALLKALGLETGEDADDGTDQAYKPEPPAEPDYTKDKNPPGRSKAITDVRAAVREMHACDDAATLLAYINTDVFKAFAFKVCCEFPKDWLGPEDNSGLSGSLAQCGANLKCQDQTDLYIHKMERARDEKLKPKQAAE